MAIALALVGGSAAVFALPPQANAHAQGSDSQTTNNTNSSQGTTSQTNGQAHMTAGKLRACQNREKTINTIMKRIDTRAQNQITLFSTIATRVESFYTKKGKTASNYDQLVAAVNAAKTKADTDFGTLHTSSTFNCSSDNPKGMVMTFQDYLKQEISDLQNYRTAVKNLIVGVAKAEGTTLSNTDQPSTQGGQQ